ncbi:DUF3558 domain-containing protein [Amycolatopsis acidicola]|uniref:DUF3558 domain-containing protein n=1 Tax=Amycolatopsis acidicola TaxID=2596893 RepID=A0A5N0V992_9PSEU|nr:DUF3558 domain-containing protein [Amycolatopsis acidicola]KAA9162088.1 DUF3558 domain-containing protein [Amycolatopsis acidicola]
MPSPAPSARPRRFFALLLAVSLTTACGPDLARQNFPRTTVTASAAPTDGPIDDPAVTLDVQRLVDPCALMDPASMASLGTEDEDARYSDDLGECHDQLTDAGGKQLRLALTLGDLLTSSADTQGTLEGLPLQVDKLDDTSCLVSVYTSRNPGLGISVQTDYDGGNSCNAGQTALQKVLQRMHNNPARLNQPKGTLLAVDFCTLVDDATITSTLGKGSKPSAYGLHGCTWDGGSATAYFDYRDTYAPTAEDDGQQVDLGNGKTAFQKKETYAGTRCTVKWVHRPTQDDQAEVVSFQYENYNDETGADDACGKAVTVVKAALPKLPTP